MKGSIYSEYEFVNLNPTEADRMRLTAHGIARLSQSGIRPDDRLLILAIATQVEDGLMVTRQDYQAFECWCKKLIDQARKLVRRAARNCRGPNCNCVSCVSSDATAAPSAPLTR